MILFFSAKISRRRLAMEMQVLEVNEVKDKTMET
jgi:hypothetical protein